MNTFQSSLATQVDMPRYTTPFNGLTILPKACIETDLGLGVKISFSSRACSGKYFLRHESGLFKRVIIRVCADATRQSLQVN